MGKRGGAQERTPMDTGKEELRVEGVYTAFARPWKHRMLLLYGASVEEGLQRAAGFRNQKAWIR
jgi:hypothetical protein